VSVWPLALYGLGLHAGRLHVHDADGVELDVPLARWLGPALARGARVVRGSVFAHVDGPFATLLLLDGNVGIGGDPVALLRRSRDLLEPGGVVLAEVGEPMVGSRRLAAAVAARSSGQPPVRVGGGRRLRRRGAGARDGFAVVDRWRAGGRWFVELRGAK
jgi:hypothetical protein